MLFNSGVFLFFFAAIYALYLISAHKVQNRLLLLASYVFYGYWDYRFLGLILISTAIDYVVGLRIQASREAGDIGTPRRWLLLSIVGNLSILAFFKYFGFFADGLSDLAGLFGWQVPAFTLEVILPVGISFYTFQTLGYTLDIYRRRLKPTRDFLDFALFVAFFPQLMAGRHRTGAKAHPAASVPSRDPTRLSAAWSRLDGCDFSGYFLGSFQEGFHR